MYVFNYKYLPTYGSSQNESVSCKTKQTNQLIFSPCTHFTPFSKTDETQTHHDCFGEYAALKALATNDILYHVFLYLPPSPRRK